MDPPVRRERGLMLALVNPMDGLTAHTTSLMVGVILYPRIWCHLFPLFVIEIGALLVEQLCQSYATLKCMAAIGHPWGWPVLRFKIDLPLTPLF